MTYSSFEVANYFIKKSLQEKRPVTPMKLQKLIYFAHGWMLGKNKEPLINELIEAWEYGPVIPSVYHEFKKYGNKPIVSYYQDDFCFDDEDIPVIPDSDKSTIALLDRIWEVYSKFPAGHLSTLTHIKKSPWDIVYNDKKRQGIKGLNIENDIIKSYFQKVLSNDKGK